jgi:hypothetical protein
MSCPNCRCFACTQNLVHAMSNSAMSMRAALGMQSAVPQRIWCPPPDKSPQKEGLRAMIDKAMTRLPEYASKAKL